MRITDPVTWEKAKDVIADALRRPAAERAAYLRERCPDPVLRAEIEEMLRAYDDDPDFLEQSPRWDDAGEPADDDEIDELADLEPGTRVGPYVIIDRLGRGGMGQVFLSSDSRLHRKVALKCLIASRSAADDRRARILHEARAAARINHPNVATVHDVIEHGNRAFIVMEYVEGESLAARLKRERIPMPRVAAIGRQLASALAAAHATNIIHRDLKPANIQLMADGSAKVLDFGVAKAFALLAPGSDRTTSDPRALLAGTPGYMSPEQMLGRDVDERSDIFSLGVILFEMTTGQRPFASADPLELVVQATRNTIGDDLERAGAPEPAVEIVSRALAPDAQDRFQTAVEMEAALAQLEHELAEADPDGAIPIYERRRNRRALLVAVASAPFAFAFFGYLTSAAFDQTFDRTAPFAGATPLEWLIWGFRSVLPIAIYMGVMTIAWQAAKFVLRVAALSPPIARAFAGARVRFTAAAAALGLEDPVVLSQAIAMVGAAALALVAWRFRDLIMAFTGSISTSPAVRFLPLRSDDLSDARWYRVSLDALMLVVAVSLYRVTQRRARRRIRHGVGGLILVAIVLLLTTLMNVVPYRILWYNRFERADYGGVRCYIIGERSDTALLYCPDTAPPRNRVVARTDGALHRSGAVESVFAPAP